MKQIAIYGAGGFGREVAWLGEACDEAYNVACFVDDDPNLVGKKLNGIPVMDFQVLKDRFPGIGVAAAIGSPSVRQCVVEKLEMDGFSSPQLIHPRTEMSRWIEMGEGAVICAGCILTTNIRLGKQVQINLGCTVGHDVVMEDYATLAPGVHVSGFVHLGKRVYVGTGAVLINGTEESPLIIGDDVVIGAGACVTKSISYGTWGGYPQENSIEDRDGVYHRPKREGIKPSPPDINPQITQIHADSGLENNPRNSRNPRMEDVDRFDTWQYPVIEDGKPTKYNWVVQHKDNLKLGYKTDIGAFTYINARHGVVIEDFVQLGSHCSVYSISTIDDKTGPVVLKKNCRIGSHSTIMPGVTVGENAIVGAHSFVNRDVPDGAVVVGVPGKIRKKKKEKRKKSG